jgi:hypothetical protein
LEELGARIVLKQTQTETGWVAGTRLILLRVGTSEGLL